MTTISLAESIKSAQKFLFEKRYKKALTLSENILQEETKKFYVKENIFLVKTMEEEDIVEILSMIYSVVMPANPVACSLITLVSRENDCLF